MTSVFLLTAAMLVGAERETSSSKQVQFDVRICRGDPKGSVRVLSSPSVTTIMNRPASVFSGAEIAVYRDGNMSYRQQGFSVQLTPRSIDKRSAEVDVDFEDSSRPDSPKLRAAVSGRFSRGEPLRLFLPTPAGEPRMWAEIVIPKAAR